MDFVECEDEANLNHPSIEIKPENDISEEEYDDGPINAVNSKQGNDKIYTAPEDLELIALLSEWKQESLAGVLIEQHVFINILKIIKRHHIERLLKDCDFGTQILFEHNLEQWREHIGLPLVLPPYQFSDRKISNPSSPASSSGSVRAQTPPRFAPYTGISTDYVISSTIHLATILNETSRGNALMEYYTKFSSFQEEQRNLLITVIAQYFEEKGIKMTLAASYHLEQDILKRFPTEKLEYYRTSKRGRLYTKFNNMTTSLKVLSKHVWERNTTQQKEGKTKNKPNRLNKLLEPESDAESCIRTLKFDDLTPEEFDNTWKACCHFRLNFMKANGTADIIKKWPFYKNPSGYRLIDMDFKTAFGNANCMLNQWEESFQRILSFLTVDNHVRDKNVKALLDTLKSDTNLSDNYRNLALIWGLHGYLVPTNKIIKKDLVTGKRTTTKFTIVDSQQSVIFVGGTRQEVENKIEHLKKNKVSIQPSVYCIGKNLSSIEKVFINFDDIRYEFNSIISALDICFKIIYLFKLEFPAESKMFYSFLETHFFKLESRNKYTKVHILNEHLSSGM